MLRCVQARSLKFWRNSFEFTERPRYYAVTTAPSSFLERSKKWLNEEYIQTATIAPEKSWQNEANESESLESRGHFREECLNLAWWYQSRRQDQVLIEAYRQHNSRVRPHCSLEYLSPFESKKLHTLSNRPHAPFLK